MKTPIHFNRVYFRRVEIWAIFFQVVLLALNLSAGEVTGKNLKEISLGMKNISGVDISPDNKRIVFVHQDRQTLTKDIWIANIDGSKATKITEGGAEAPQWSPDGKKIVYISTAPDNQGIWIVNISNKEKKQLVKERTAKDPGFSPDGRKIIFCMYKENWGIWIYDMKSKRTRLLSEKGERYPAFSPDGRRIACSWQDNIWIIPYKKKRIERYRITNHRVPGYYTQPSWSPDGRYIVCVDVLYPDVDNVCIIRASPGSNPVLLTSGHTGAETPHFLKNGKNIIFVGEDSQSNMGIWTVGIREER